MSYNTQHCFFSIQLINLNYVVQRIDIIRSLFVRLSVPIKSHKTA